VGLRAGGAHSMRFFFQKQENILIADSVLSRPCHLYCQTNGRAECHSNYASEGLREDGGRESFIRSCCTPWVLGGWKRESLPCGCRVRTEALNARSSQGPSRTAPQHAQVDAHCGTRTTQMRGVRCGRQVRPEVP